MYDKSKKNVQETSEQQQRGVDVTLPRRSRSSKRSAARLHSRCVHSISHTHTASRCLAPPSAAMEMLRTPPFMLWCRGHVVYYAAFSVSAPSVWNSLSYNYRSAELLSTFKRSLETELFDVASYRKREPLIRSRHSALYECVLID